MNLKIEYAASAEDGLAAVEVLKSVSLWLEEQDQPLWKPAQFSQVWLQQHLDKKELVIARDRKMIIATMLLMLEDQAFWADYPLGEAVFVHKLAVARAYAGQGIATQLLEFAAREAKRVGRRFVRLDAAQRSALTDFYEANGFARVDQKVVSELTYWRYQRDLAYG